VRRSGFDFMLAKDGTYSKSDDKGKYEICIFGTRAACLRACGLWKENRSEKWLDLWHHIPRHTKIPNSPQWQWHYISTYSRKNRLQGLNESSNESVWDSPMTGILTQSASLVNDLKHPFEVNMKSELILFTL